MVAYFLQIRVVQPVINADTWGDNAIQDMNRIYTANPRVLLFVLNSRFSLTNVVTMIGIYLAYCVLWLGK